MRRGVGRYEVGQDHVDELTRKKKEHGMWYSGNEVQFRSSVSIEEVKLTGSCGAHRAC